MLNFGLIFLGLGLLFFGGEWLTLGASRLAGIMGVRPIIIGLTVVAFGTSMPEAFVSIFASFSGEADISLGNIVGSNLFNSCLILGVASLIHPLKVESRSLKRETPFLILSVVILWLFSIDGILSRWEGAAFLVLFGSFLYVCFKSALAEQEQVFVGTHSRDKITQFGLIVLGLIFLVVGTQVLLHGCVALAKSFHISERVIGLTIVAAGTSLPELATSVMASWRKQDDIAIGNVTGSNIFNILFILGMASLILPVPVNPGLVSRDVPILALVSLGLLPILWTGHRISRWEGALLLMGFLVYLSTLAFPETGG